MRVSVDLSKYFNDHRSLAYIFINKKTMPYIQDVEERITKIFNIDNFYLIQQDHYLPSLEDVSLLVDHCDLRVIPVNQTNCTVSDDCSMKPEKIKKKKKKTKEQTEETMNVEREDLENDEKLKQNRKRRLIDENDEDDNDDKLKIQKKKSKIDKHNHQTIYTNRRETFKEHLDKILIKKDEIIKRSPNIVKTIIISGNNLIKTDDNKVTALNDSSNDSSSSTETPNEPNTAEDMVKPKRRRKRTRKRKQRIVNNGETIQQYAKDTENLTPKLPPLQKASGLHIRFSDDGQVVEGTQQAENKSETQQQEEITVGNDNAIKDTVENNTNNKINDSYILKQPLIVNILPKINDLIAFKILRLNETYAPELSPFIIGKLIEFNVDDDKEMTFDIKQGLDYCLPPQGKFSMETEEQTADQKTTEYTFKLSELIEPRLIYP